MIASLIIATALCGLFSASDARGPDEYVAVFETDIPIPRAHANVTAGDTYKVRFNVVRAWAPLGADRFYDLVKSGFYNESAFFRVVPRFVVQFGIAGEPQVNARWNTSTIKDDPVVKSNLPGFISFATAGPNTRTTQVFVNTVDNARLDSMGFAPFGYVAPDNGYLAFLNVVNPTPGDSNGVDQDDYSAYGNRWVRAKYPTIQFTTAAYVASAVYHA